MKIFFANQNDPDADVSVEYDDFFCPPENENEISVSLYEFYNNSL